MNKKPEQNSIALAEYLFLLPQVLSVAPLFSALTHMRHWGETADFVYGFRLITLAYLLMVTAIILYIWRPSVRRRYSFRRNLTRASVLGILATVPIPLAAQVLTTFDDVRETLFTPLEVGVSSFALLICVVVNVGCLVNLVKTRLAPRFHRFDFLSVAVLLMLVGLWVRWW